MSGGVDSSAAAALLKEQGHELVGFTMQLWNQNRNISVDENGDPLPSRCCSLDDVYDARRVADTLGFPFYVLNLEREFEAFTSTAMALLEPAIIIVMGALVALIILAILLPILQLQNLTGL